MQTSEIVISSVLKFARVHTGGERLAPVADVARERVAIDGQVVEELVSGKDLLFLDKQRVGRNVEGGHRKRRIKAKHELAGRHETVDHVGGGMNILRIVQNAIEEVDWLGSDHRVR